MIRVLQITDNMHLGGIQSFLMNIYRLIDKKFIQFDFLVFREDLQMYESEIYTLGGNVFKIPGRNKGMFIHKKALCDFFEKQNYSTIHYHASSLSNIEVLKVAKKYGVKNIIMHSHNTRYSGSKIHGVLHFLNRMQITRYANVLCACGNEAALWMYGKKRLNRVNIVYNGIDLKLYEFNQDKREEHRQYFNVPHDSKIFFNIGRLSEAKNHETLLDIFEQIFKKQPNSYLFIIGDGDRRVMLENKTLSLSAKDHIKFLGIRSDINDLLHMTDAIIMPSIYEGFPVTLIEAQANGITCFVSTNITNEAKISPNVYSISLLKNADEWADFILNCNLNRNNDLSKLIDKGLSIENTIDRLLLLYN